ncbi:MAG: response regulator transcription factor [Bacteroidales bacterium]|nr:response regulator transcription factor [Bacteroidales bacterium]
MELRSQQIADKVCLSLATIKWYRKRLLEKFQATNTAELVSILKEKGLL